MREEIPPIIIAFTGIFMQNSLISGKRRDDTIFASSRLHLYFRVYRVITTFCMTFSLPDRRTI
jgi:hypothetical protein